MRNDWTDELALDEDAYAPAPGRNPDSSVAPRYEDSVPPDRDEEYEPS